MCIKKHPKLTESISFQTGPLGAVTTAQLVKSMPVNHEELRFIPSIHMKSWPWWPVFVIPVLEILKQKFLWDPLASQPRVICEPWLPIRDPVPNIMVDLSCVDLRPLSSTYVHTHIGLSRPLYFQALPLSLCFNHLALALR